MKLYIPYKKWIITQKYAENANTYYAESGRKGHGAWDIVGMGDKTIYASTDSYVYSVRNRNNPDLMVYRAVYTLVEDSGIFYELVYGHCSDIYVQTGQSLKRGDKLALEGNTGNVASGGIKITADMKRRGSMAGAHLHFQLRLLKPSEKKETGKKYLAGDDLKTFKKDGLYFEILNYKNGYSGCIDPEPFIVLETAKPSLITEILNFGKFEFTRNLKYGSRGNDVRMLQTLLHIIPDGIFGYQTEKAVKEFQAKNGLIVDGIAGANTFYKLNK